jgi:hypothetical protein
MTYLYFSDYSKEIIRKGRTGPLRLSGKIIIIIILTPSGAIRPWRYTSLVDLHFKKILKFSNLFVQNSHYNLATQIKMN